MKQDAKAECYSIKKSASALISRLQQGPITAITSSKYLRRADKVEVELEEELEKVVGNKISASSATTSKTAKDNKTSSSGKTTSADDKVVNIDPKDITEDFLFGDGTDDIPVSAAK